jgi:Protein of unknown function (DUF2852)
MASYANNDAYGNPWGNPAWSAAQGNGPGQASLSGQGGRPGQSWGGPPWATQGWDGPFGWHPARLGKAASIALVVLGFILWWPVGLAVLFYMIGSGRMGCWGRRARDGYQSGWQGAPWSGWKSWCSSGPAAQSSGNRAFDEYRTETLRRLEEEQKEFGTFLDRLRFAKDKSEFDQFMAERRNGQRPAPTQDEPPAA